MGHYALPLDKDIYDSSPAKTYGNHGPGRLDMGFSYGATIYSISDGEVTGVGIYTDGVSYCHIKTSDSILGEFTIRYLHCEYTVQAGDQVSKGQPIGTVASYGTPYPHLHIDLQIDPYNYNDNSFLGTLNYAERTFKILGKTYHLNERVDLSIINTFNSQKGYEENHPLIGYNWLIFAQEPEHLSPVTPTPTEDSIPINLDYYYNSTKSAHDNPSAIQAITNDNLKTSFIGPYPENWDIYNSSDCDGLRWAIAVAQHETGAFGPFPALGWAKIWRNNIIAVEATHTSASTLNEWLENLTRWKFPGFVDERYAVDQYGKALNGPDSPYGQQEYLITIYGDKALDYVKAFYKNLKFPQIFGLNLPVYNYITNTESARDNLYDCALKAMHGLCIANGGYWDTIQYSNFLVNWNPYIGGKDEGKINHGDDYYNHFLQYRGDGNYTASLTECYDEFLE